MIQFEIPKNQSSIIKVIGVGGGGGNAVNHMYNLGVESVDFMICNTDAQALALSQIPNKIQLGPNLTQGLGAGANPEIGKQACEESLDDITKILKVNTRMAFITAGMGGGTGTGGAPVVAKICKDLGILTVGIVSTPFSQEGRRRMTQAEEGIAKLKEHVDTLLIISNDKLRQQCGNMPYRQALAKADDILATAAKCITDVITTTGQINVDFADVCTVMKEGGRAILGNAVAEGEHRAQEAVENALNSPLLNDNDIYGAKWILLNITSAEGEFEHTMDEVDIIQSYVQQKAGDACDVILGMGNDTSLGNKIGVTVIATGFNYTDATAQNLFQENKKVVVTLEKPNTNVANTAVVENTSTTPVDTIVNSEKTIQQNTVASISTLEVEKKADEIVNNVWERNLDFLENPKEKVETNFKLSAPIEIQAEVPTEAVVKPVEESKKELQAEPIATKTSTSFVERILSAEEMEERRIFEEQKRQLEERAERLRRLSFNVQNAVEPETIDKNDIENVPAYLRKEIKLEESTHSSESFLSQYTISGQSLEDQKSAATLHSINTFLDGKKPD